MALGEDVCEDETVGDMNRGVVLLFVGLLGDLSVKALYLYLFVRLDLDRPPLFAVVVMSVKVSIS